MRISQSNPLAGYGHVKYSRRRRKRTWSCPRGLFDSNDEDACFRGVQFGQWNMLWDGTIVYCQKNPKRFAQGLRTNLPTLRSSSALLAIKAVWLTHLPTPLPPPLPLPTPTSLSLSLSPTRNKKACSPMMLVSMCTRACFIHPS